MQLEEIQLQKRGELSTDTKQIYIVDDDESVGRALKFLLMTYGFNVNTFSNAADFLNKVSNRVPGLLILDIHMPGLDGWQTQERLSKSGSRRPVIFISADKNGELRERALESGAVGFFQKPFNPRAMVALINVALAKK